LGQTQKFSNCFFLVLALSHLYGREGRDSKKIDTKSLLLDFECFKHLSHPDFIAKLNVGIHDFLQQINEKKHIGSF